MAIGPGIFFAYADQTIVPTYMAERLSFPFRFVL